MFKPMQKMLAEMNIVLLRYQRLEQDKDLPTPKQLQDNQTKVLKKAKDFRQLLLPLGKDSAVHFWGSIMSAKANGKATHNIEDSEYDKLLKEIDQNGNSLMRSLNWFIRSLEACLENEYPTVKNPAARKLPETQFIKNLSYILKEYFSDGGLWRGDHSDQNSAEGWHVGSQRILCS